MRIWICIAVYTVHVITQNIDGVATEADGGASVPVGPNVATPLAIDTDFHNSVVNRRYGIFRIS